MNEKGRKYKQNKWHSRNKRQKLHISPTKFQDHHLALNLPPKSVIQFFAFRPYQPKMDSDSDSVSLENASILNLLASDEYMNLVVSVVESVLFGTIQV